MSRRHWLWLLGVVVSLLGARETLRVVAAVPLVRPSPSPASLTHTHSRLAHKPPDVDLSTARAREMGDGRDRAISESLKGVDISKLRQGIVGQRGFDRMGMMAGPAAALGIINPVRPTATSTPSPYAYSYTESSGSSSGSSSSEEPKSAEFLARPVSSVSQRPARFSRDLYPEEELEGRAFLEAQESRLISLTVYIVQQQLKKKVRVPACISVSEAVRRVATAAHISESQAHHLHMFLPSCSIFLAPQRKMWSYLLREDVRLDTTLLLLLLLSRDQSRRRHRSLIRSLVQEQLELKKRSTDLVFRQASVTVQIPGTDDTTQSIEYLPQTTAAGVVRAITRKICDRVPKYGIFHGSTLLLPEDTLSARRLQDSVRCAAGCWLLAERSPTRNARRLRFKRLLCAIQSSERACVSL